MSYTNANLIDGTTYSAIATLFGAAYAANTGTSANFLSAVNYIVLLNTVVPTVDLIDPFYNAYTINAGRVTSTQIFDSAVRSIQSHVARNYAGPVTTDSVNDFIVNNVPGAKVTSAWATLSAAVGFTILSGNIAG